MNSRTALVAHPYPIVVDALAAIVAAAGYGVIRANDAGGVATGLAARPQLALVDNSFDGAAARDDATRTIVIGDGFADGVISLTASAERISAAIIAATGDPESSPSVPALTPRERDVARLVAAGQRNRMIADALGISEGTVKMHLHNVYAKLGLESRTQLAMATRTLAA